MENLFSQDGWLFRFFSRMWDILVLNLLWLLTSIPLVTIGASTTALYTVTLKMVRNEDSYLVKSYLKAFKENFLKATGAWLLLAAGWFLLLVDIFWLGKSMGDYGFFIIFAAGICLVIWFLITLYLFPMLARYENTLVRTIMNSFYVSIRYFGCTVQMSGILVFPGVVLVLIILKKPEWVGYLTGLLMLVGVSGLNYLCAYPLRKVMDQLEKIQ